MGGLPSGTRGRGVMKTLISGMRHHTLHPLLFIIMPMAVVSRAPTCKIKTLHVCAPQTCVTNVDGRMRCWGLNADCRLGIGDFNNRGDTPGSMGGNLPFINTTSNGISAAPQFYVGSRGGCSVSSSGETRCWGDDEYGYNGGETTGDICSPSDTGAALALPVPTSCRVFQVVLAHRHSCLLCSDRLTVYCWGQGTYGALGSGNTANRGGTPNWGSWWPPTDLGINHRIIKLVGNNGGGGNSHLFMCVLISVNAGTAAGGTTKGMKCWGHNADGQLGYGDTNNR
eukprot:Hpha_TRINITY_DN11153_c0_g1::TRINITY_DN11153_c0_g1_i1::g.28241::m.28241